MAKIEELPTTFLEGALRQNPDTAVFSWGMTRKEIEADLKRRAQEEAELARIETLKVYKPPGPLRLEDAAIKSTSLGVALDYARHRSWPLRVLRQGDFSETITALIFTSPVRSHPCTWLVDETRKSIEQQLPGVRVVILADGVDGEEPGSYREFKATLRGRDWPVVEFEGWHHQTLMLRDALLRGAVETPLVLIAEHDWPFRPLLIDWQAIVDVLMTDGRFKLIQMHQDDVIGAWELRFLSLPQEVGDITVLPSINYQCPNHIARTDWYLRLVQKFMKPEMLECTEIETALEANNAFSQMAIYLPPGSFGRVTHLNGYDALPPRDYEYKPLQPGK